jgi:hypothetical protein
MGSLNLSMVFSPNLAQCIMEMTESMILELNNLVVEILIENVH